MREKGGDSSTLACRKGGTSGGKVARVGKGKQGLWKARQGRAG